MCIRSSSALARHIERWMRRYWSRSSAAGASAAARSTFTSSVEGPGDVNHLGGGHAHPLQVVVVRPLEVGEVGALGAFLAELLDLRHDPVDERRLRPKARLTERVLDHQGARVLAVDIAHP